MTKKPIISVVSKSDYVTFWEDTLVRTGASESENLELSLRGTNNRKAFFRHFTGDYSSIIQFEVMGRPFARAEVREIHFMRKSTDGLVRGTLVPINVTVASLTGDVPLDQQNVPLLALRDESVYVMVDCHRFELLEERMY